MTLSSIGSSSPMLQLQQAMFSRADANSDGQLSSDEFLSIGQNLQGGGSSDPARPMRPGGETGANFASEMLSSLLSLQAGPPSAEDLFAAAAADGDGDGLLSAEELAADMTAHAPPGREGVDAAERATAFLSMADADGDGALSSSEFEAARPAGPPPGGPPPSSAVAGASTGTEGESYDAADANQDGVVSMAELLTSLQASESRTSGFSSEASDLLRQLLDRLSSDTTSTVEAAA